MLRFTFAFLLALWLVWTVGCQKQNTATSLAANTPKTKDSKAHSHDHEHDHPTEGPHHGALAEWGEHDYHVEFTVDHKTKSATIYILDGEAKKAPTLDPAKITQMKLAISAPAPAFAVDLQHDKARTDGKGIAFTTTHDNFAKEVEFKGTVSGKVAGTPYSGEFQEKAEGDHKHSKDKASGNVHLENHPGGVHVLFAQGRYYAEVVLHKGGTLHLFLFGKDLAKVVEAESQTVTAYIRKQGDKEFTTFEFTPEPLSGDEKGYTSRFVAKVPAELIKSELEVTIPALKVGGNRFHLAFQTKGHDEDHKLDPTMPSKNSDQDEEKKLFLTAAGLYTTDDIKANGNVVGSEKFKNFKASHDLKPKAGDKICPVTLTKANPDCSWIIGGKKYEFCCPPCVEEFIGLAKENPTAVKQPEEYVKK